MDTRTVKIKEKEFIKLMQEASSVFNGMNKKKESLDSFYKIQGEIDSINKKIDGEFSDIFQNFLIKNNIVSKINYLSSRIKNLEYKNLSIEYTKDSEKFCTIHLNENVYRFKQPSLREALSALLGKEEPLYPLLYLFYSNKERKHNFKETILLNMFLTKIQK